MNSDELRMDLVSKIQDRLSHDTVWAKRDFMIAQFFLWLAIFASFLTAILAAAEAVSKIYLAFISVIPGAVILIDKNFSFSKRAQWHWEMAAKLDQLLNRLLFQKDSIEKVSEEYSEFRIRMESIFPGIGAHQNKHIEFVNDFRLPT